MIVNFSYYTQYNKDKLSIEQRQKDNETYRPIFKQIHRYKDEETNKHRDKDTDRQTDTQKARNQARDGSKIIN